MRGYISFTHKHKGFRFVKYWAGSKDDMELQMAEVKKTSEKEFVLFTVRGTEKYLRHNGKTIDVEGKLYHWDIFFQHLFGIFGTEIKMSELSVV